MKINNTPPVGPLGHTDSTRTGSKAPAGAKDNNAPDNSSPGALQDTGRHDIDPQRVDEIRTAIREGRLDINTGKIADGLLNSVRDLLNGKH